MRIAFRADASAEIGSGHLMRCLTLADALRERGAQTRFLSRRLPPVFEQLVGGRQHAFSMLADGEINTDSGLAHAHWLRVTQAVDAQQCLDALGTSPWDWLVVDHYGIDERWERGMRRAARAILAVDDLADRRHDCDVLLDQNYHEGDSRYHGLTPPGATLLLGPRYALLRDEFRVARAELRQRGTSLSRVLIFFGGSDIENYTRCAVDAVAASGIPGLRADVVLGAQHPDVAGITAACLANGFACHHQTAHMAQLMAAADVAIGASGSASWERCCLGLPAICVATAANQVPILDGLEALGAVVAVRNLYTELTSVLVNALRDLARDAARLTTMSAAASAAVDGAGADRVRRRMVGAA